MATVKLKIRNDLVKKNGKDTETTIYVQYCFDGKIKLFNTGEKVLPDNWDSASNQVKRSEGYTVINGRINHKKSEVERLVRKAEFENILPTLEYIEREYEKLSQPSQFVDTHKDFFTVYEHYIQVRSTDPEISLNTFKHYKTTRNHIRNFAEKKRIHITFEIIDNKFYDELRRYLFAVPLRPNTVGREIKELKSFLSWATANGYNKKLDFRAFKKPKEDTEIVVLSKEELERLTSLDLGKNPRLDRVRDLFVLGCYTGLRFSDLVALKPENFDGDYIKIRTVKTKDYIRVPILPVVRKLINKYDYKLPKISNQKMNEYLKELAVLADITAPQHQVKYIEGKRVEVTTSKAELLTSHAARRTFITQALKAGMPQAVLIKITGHKDLKTMQRYVHVTEDDTAVALLRAFA